MSNGSLFDILGPVMVGPSSSHTAGAVRLANLARSVATGEIESVEFILYNSFAKTYKGHGTDKGLLSGIMDYGVEDERIRDAFSLAKTHGLPYKFTCFEGKNHYSPNTVTFKINLKAQFQKDSLEHTPGEAQTDTLSITGHSLGGGKVYISKINDYNVSLKGELPTILIHYKDQPGMIWQVTKVLAEHQINIASLTCNRSQRGVSAFMTITLDSLPQKEDVAKIEHIQDIYWCRCIDQLPSFLEV
ncbi:MAG: L-serine ammonia-lyase, iron-sulfur-dependent subunit beta [Vampirovibrionales bacterium]|nr:L-serine ammonia-lyase, iron-sulfur-dependent subunit beta [Vampirovibrionales bacterium]